MWDFPLNNISHKLYAISNYRNYNSTWNEFFQDLKLLNSIYRLISNYQIKKDNVKNIINTYTHLTNVFKKESLARLLLSIAPEDQKSYIKTILYIKSNLPESIPDFDINAIDINKDFYLDIISNTQND